MEPLRQCFDEWRLASVRPPSRACVSPSVVVSSPDGPDCWLETGCSGDSGVVSASSQPRLTEVSDADISEFIERLRRQVIGLQDEDDDELYRSRVFTVGRGASSRPMRRRKNGVQVEGIGVKASVSRSYDKSRDISPERSRTCYETCSRVPNHRPPLASSCSPPKSSITPTSSSSSMFCRRRSPSSTRCTLKSSSLSTSSVSPVPHSPSGAVNGTSSEHSVNSPLYKVPLLTYPLQAVDGGAALVDSSPISPEPPVCPTAAVDTPHLARFLQARRPRGNDRTAPSSRPSHQLPPADWQLQLMRRAADRRERCLKLEERRLQKQQASRSQQLQQAKQQQQMLLQQSRERLRRLVERRHRDEERRRCRADMLQLCREKEDRAAWLHRLRLLRAAFAALRHNVQMCKVKRQEAMVFDRARRQRCLFRRWRSQCYLSIEMRTNRAGHWYCHQLLRTSLKHWQQFVRRQVMKHQAACDFYSLHLTHTVFSAWKRFHFLQQQKLQHQLHLAAQLCTRLVCRRALRCWRHLPSVLRTEREIEARRNRLRCIVREIIPDFSPPPPHTVASQVAE